MLKIKKYLNFIFFGFSFSLHALAFALIYEMSNSSLDESTDKGFENKQNIEISLLEQQQKSSSEKDSISKKNMNSDEFFGTTEKAIIDSDVEASSSNKVESFYGLGVKLGEPMYLTLDNLRYKSIKIEKVFKGYAAAKAGIKSGDILVRVNGFKFSESQISFNKPQDAIIEVIRDSKLLKYKVHVGRVLVANE